MHFARRFATLCSNFLWFRKLVSGESEWIQCVEAAILKVQIDHHFPAESAFDRCFHLEDPSQIRLGPNNNPVVAGSLGMKKKPLYSHLHQPAVYQEHKVTLSNRE